MRRGGGLIIYHGVMLKVELQSGGLHSVLIEGLRRKSSESRSLFQREKRVTCSSDWSLVVRWKLETRHRSVMIGGTLQWGLSGVVSRPLRLNRDSGGSTR